MAPRLLMFRESSMGSIGSNGTHLLSHDNIVYTIMNSTMSYRVYTCYLLELEVVTMLNIPISCHSAKKLHTKLCDGDPSVPIHLVHTAIQMQLFLACSVKICLRRWHFGFFGGVRGFVLFITSYFRARLAR